MQRIGRSYHEPPRTTRLPGDLPSHPAARKARSATCESAEAVADTIRQSCGERTVVDDALRVKSERHAQVGELQREILAEHADLQELERLLRDLRLEGVVNFRGHGRGAVAAAPWSAGRKEVRR